MREVISEIHIKVYSDGSFEAKKIFRTELPDLIRNSSRRTTQAVSTILQMHNLKKRLEETNQEIDYNRLYNQALSLVAQNLNLQISTVRDKLERKMGETAEEVQDLIKAYFTNNDMRLKNVMIDSVRGTRKELEDIAAIEELFRMMSS
jgi:hypothetical protein